MGGQKIILGGAFAPPLASPPGAATVLHTIEMLFVVSEILNIFHRSAGFLISEDIP